MLNFYNEPGLDRLEQLTATYITIIELISFVMFSQLWDALQDNKDLNIEEDQRKLLSYFFQLRYDERLTYNFFPLIKTIRDIFDQNKIPYFIQELSEVSKVFNEQSDFYNACFFMETLKRRFAQRVQIEQQEAAQLCVVAEEKLALILKQASFMALYKMSSIKDIDVLKYRHSNKITYRHQVVELVQRLGGLGDKEKKKEYLLDRSSVVMYRQDRENEFLNLSPFVIDENAFVKSATVSNLFFFERYEKAADVYCFKQIHKPDKMKLMIGNQENFAIIKEQFGALADLLFHQPMKAL
ncbi:MAG: hypothetical protein IPJ74_13545 [Saprospiraceae bacterium]|nr:hypothetical protein [Saprospiraceae bacterium]